ncbi:MAG: DUF4394 domain-containing protein [Armatimonadetes bacterium]|nr:DUF4394 domain-containing protein [Armatimonadota bacterium]
MNIRTPFFLSLAVLAACPLATAQDVMAVTTGNRLVRFQATDPTQILADMSFTGLSQNDLVLGLDYRPATGELYAMGSSSTLYKVDAGTGQATAVGAPFAPGLNGVEFGFDFNPTVDRIRVTSDKGQNLRLNPNTGQVAVVDTDLAFAAGDPNAGARPNIVGSAYTNNFNGATSTTLFDIDSDLDVLVTQVPPNNGTLNTVGSLGLDVTSLVGFDVLGTDQAYAALTRAGDFRSAFYRIDLSTGKAGYIGAIGGDVFQIRDIAMVPEPSSAVVLTLGALLLRRKKRS